MSQEDTQQIHPDAMELAEIMRSSWPIIDRGLQLSGVPLNEGDAGAADGDAAGAAPAKDAAAAANGDAGTKGDDKQQVFPREVVEELRRENAASRKRAQEAEARAKEFEDRDLSEQQKLEKRAAEAEGKLTPLEQENARLRVALKKGLTGDKAALAERLRGSTEEELMADADELLKLAGGGGRSGFDGGSRQAAPANDMDTLIRQRAGYAT